MPCTTNPSLNQGFPNGLPCARKKEDEKTRSKTNRQHFKSLLGELNNCVSDTTLNNNSTLEIAVAVSKLNAFYNDLTPLKTSEILDVDHFLKIKNSIGIGFIQSGVILYATEQLSEYFKDIRYLIGCPMNKIIYNSAEVIKQVFVNKQTNFLLQMKRNYRSKKSLDIFITGKLMENSAGEQMLLGYSKIKPFAMYKNLPLAVTGCYMVGSLSLEIVKGHPYIDYLLNSKMKGTCSTMYPHPDDMKNSTQVFKSLKENNFVESMVRLLRMEEDGTHKYVHCVVNLNTFKDVNGNTRIASLLWPFAMTKDGTYFSMDDMEMININPSLDANYKFHSKQFSKSLAKTEGVFGEEHLTMSESSPPPTPTLVPRPGPAAVHEKMSSPKVPKNPLPPAPPLKPISPPKAISPPKVVSPPKIIPPPTTLLNPHTPLKQDPTVGDKRSHNTSCSNGPSNYIPQSQLADPWRRPDPSLSTTVCRDPSLSTTVCSSKPEVQFSFRNDEARARFTQNSCMDRVNAKVGPDTAISKDAVDQPPPLECWQDYRPDREACPSKATALPQTSAPQGNAFGTQFLSKRPSNPTYNTRLDTRKLPHSASDFPDLLPTIEPKLEMLDFTETMPKMMDYTRPRMDMLSLPSSSTSDVIEMTSEMQYNPSAAVRQQSQPDANPDLAFDPPVEMFQIMNDFWSAYLF